MGLSKRVALAAAVAISGGAALGQPQQQVTGPVAVYWMSAATTSGFGAGMMGAGAPGASGARPGRGIMPNMSALMGGGAAQKMLTLQLGSTQRPAGDPKADHLPPASLRAGPDLPLLTPRAAPAPEPSEPGVPQQFQRPRGRMLIFWGCGERAPQGQPVIIDFATLTDPAQAQRLAGLLRGLDVRPMQPPSPSRNATYGEWPNEQTRQSVPPEGSLAGAHTVRGNYSPEISFTLQGDQDFLAPLTLTTNDRNPGGWIQLGWNPVPRATGYFATAIGGSEGGDTVVLWTSSQTQAATFAAPDYIAPDEARRLVSAGALLSPQTTTCNVYREVVQAAPSAMLQMTAYGDEANFAYPPRPDDRTKPWNIQWTVKVRYRSSTGAILGMNMGAMPGVPQSQPQPSAPTPPRRPSAGDILRGLGLP